MVILFVIVSFAICIFISWLVDKKRVGDAEAARPAAAVGGAAASRQLVRHGDLLFHPGHSWIHEQEDRLVTMGTTDFTVRLMGELAAVELPKVGTQLRQGEPAWKLVSRRGRRLTQVAPASGEVVAVNYDLLKDPEALKRSPYNMGWIARIRPRHLGENAANLLSTSLVGAWMDAIKNRVMTELTPALGATATDGGEWVQDLGDLLDDETFERLRHDLYPRS